MLRRFVLVRLCRAAGHLHDVCDRLPAPGPGGSGGAPPGCWGFPRGTSIRTAVERPCGQGGSCNSLDQDFVLNGGSGEGLYPRRRSCLCSGASAAGSLPMGVSAWYRSRHGKGTGSRVAHGEPAGATSLRPAGRRGLRGTFACGSPQPPAVSLSMGEPGVLDVAVVGSAGVGVALQRLVEAVQSGPDHLDPVQGVDRQAGVVAVEDVAVLAWASTTGGSL
jgi:hypothetical protein